MRRYALIGGILIAAALCAAPPLAAQVAQYQDRPLQPLSQVKRIEEKCELLLQWLGRVDTEWPSGGARRPEAVNLYRDEDFVPLFGVAFDRTSDSWRLDVHEDVIGPCQGVASPGGARKQAPVPGYAARFRAYAALLDGPFLGDGGTFDFGLMSRAIAEARTKRAWMSKTIAETTRVPMSMAAFRALQTTLAAGDRELSALWPSERAFFKTSVERVRGEVARNLGDAWLASFGTMPQGLAGVQSLQNQRQQNAEIIDAIPGPQRDVLVRRYEAAIDAALVPVVDARAAELADVPGSVEGLARLAEWKTAFERDFRAVANRPPVAAGLARYAQARDRALQASLPSWRAGVEAAPLNNEALQAQQSQLAQLFPDAADRSGAAYAQYQATIAARVDALRQAEARARESAAAAERAAAEKAADDARRAEAARVAAVREVERKALASRLAATNAERARKGLPPIKASCDELATHPDDPVRGTAAGVADDVVVADAAIAACLAAVQQDPSNARAQFQLGRAYWAARQYDDALEAFLAAEERDYAPAYFYLGLAYEEGRIEGEAPDLAAASEMYMLAAAEGFAPAVEAYQGIEWDWTVDFQAMANPRFAQLIHDYVAGQAPSIASADRRLLLGYMIGANNFMTLQPNEFDAACPAVASPQISSRLEQLARVEMGMSAQSSGSVNDVIGLLQRASRMSLDQAFAEASLNAKAEAAVQQGTDDIYALVADYGGCNGQPVRQFYSNLGAVADALGAR